MKKVLGLVFLFALSVLTAQAQEKGVDQQNDRIRDQGSDRAPGQNGTKQNNGTGRGFDFGKGRTPLTPLLANPYRFTVRRDVVLRAVQELMAEQKLVVDTAVSKPEEGVIVSQPFRFVKGAVTAVTELNRFAEVPRDNVSGWTQGRYTLIVEVRAVDAATTNVSVNARVEGRADSASGAEWISLRSNGSAEQQFIRDLVEKVTGGTP
ncbi:MAG: hypothetical protein QOE33_702 [Acidobacteriota bacterium]|nr:hypothetical protein [Acidobacteriota bacterium]